MIDNTHISKIILSITALALAALLVFMVVFGQTTQAAASGISMAYENSLFSTDSIINVDISISESDWEDLLENAISEEYYSCDVMVNGTEYKNVGFRAKGNTSLSMVASSDSDRYSFKISFDEYVDGQNCDGLSKLVLNNNYSDATMMKEAICYDMFAFLGADASLYNYAKVSINGEYYGVYLALEPVEESFAMRNYGTNYGELYKPDSMEMGGPGKMKDWDGEMPDFTGEKPESTNEMPDFSGNTDEASEKPSGNPPAMPSDTDNSDKPSGQPPAMPSGGDMPSPPDRTSDSDSEKNDNNGGMGGKDFGMGSGSGANLNYTDDNLDSYEAIWESSVFNTTDKDHRRVVKALKNICADDTGSKTPAEYMDVDNVLRYMAVQTFVVNLDSLSGNMAHNYYLYESDSKLNIIPWDYNLAFGGFQSQDASDVINFPIDTPFSSGVSTEDRQFFMSLLENDDYLEQYHEYLRQLTDEYVGGGIFENTVSRITSQIDDLVESDPTSFYSYTEYKSAVEMLEETVSLRAESIRDQLDGTIPSTRSGQEEDASALVDSSSIDLTVIGVMNAGGGRGKDSARDFGGFDFSGERSSDGEDDNRPAPNGAG